MNPTARLARLAVALDEQGNGLRESLLQDSVKWCLAVRSDLGVRILIVDALHASAAAFYRLHGFRNASASALTLYLSLGKGQGVRLQDGSALAPSLQGAKADTPVAAFNFRAGRLLLSAVIAAHGRKLRARVIGASRQNAPAVAVAAVSNDRHIGQRLPASATGALSRLFALQLRRDAPLAQ